MADTAAGATVPGRKTKTRVWSLAYWFHSRTRAGKQATTFGHQPCQSEGHGCVQRGSLTKHWWRSYVGCPRGCCQLWEWTVVTEAVIGLVTVCQRPGSFGYCSDSSWSAAAAPPCAGGCGGSAGLSSSWGLTWLPPLFRLLQPPHPRRGRSAAPVLTGPLQRLLQTQGPGIGAAWMGCGAWFPLWLELKGSAGLWGPRSVSAHSGGCHRSLGPTARPPASDTTAPAPLASPARG